jgi:hypothetical protein
MANAFVKPVGILIQSVTTVPHKMDVLNANQQHSVPNVTVDSSGWKILQALENAFARVDIGKTGHHVSHAAPRLRTAPNASKTASVPNASTQEKSTQKRQNASAETTLTKILPH